jgi:hypothetical protein
MLVNKSCAAIVRSLNIIPKIVTRQRFKTIYNYPENAEFHRFSKSQKNSNTIGNVLNAEKCTQWLDDVARVNQEYRRKYSDYRNAWHYIPDPDSYKKYINNRLFIENGNMVK